MLQHFRDPSPYCQIKLGVCVSVCLCARACGGAGKVGKRNERTGKSILVLSFTLIKSPSRLEKIYLMCSFKVDGGLLEWVGGLRTRL